MGDDVRGGSGTFAQPLDGGPEEKLFDSARSYFAVVKNGIYYWAARGSDGIWPLMFFDLKLIESFR